MILSPCLIYPGSLIPLSWPLDIHPNSDKTNHTSYDENKTKKEAFLSQKMAGSLHCLGLQQLID